MKTQKQQLSKKAISTILFIVVLFSCQNVFAQTQNMQIENDGLIHNITFMVSILLFIVGFTILIMLKQRDESKQQSGDSNNQQMHVRHRNHCGRRHQYNH